MHSQKHSGQRLRLANSIRQSLKASTYAGSTLAAGLFFTTGCTPQQPNVPPVPTATAIFSPDPNFNFAADSGNLDIAQLAGKTVCYTVNGPAPALSNDSCAGEAQSLVDSRIALSCDDDETSASTIKSVKLAFDWEGSVASANANFILNCTPPEADTDGDGIPDSRDNCPADANPDQLDSNSNGTGDACEGSVIADADADTRADDFDNCPNVWNQNQSDDDNDGIGDVCDDEPQGPAPALWANDDLAKAFVRWKDQVQCDIRCSDPTSGGDIGSISCENGGTANWQVDLNVLGGKADSIFTYTNCQYTTAEGDTLRVDGTLTQYSDLSGNGHEEGTVSILGGDYVGQVTSATTFANKNRNGGKFSVSCTEDPLSNEICAPNSLITDHPYPDWECSGAFCPQPRDPLADSDGDGVFDLYDNCVNTANSDQANIDFDAFGDACDDSTDTQDSDNDGIPDAADNCPIYPNPAQEDADNDGLGDACDGTFDPDTDGDGIIDANDNCVNHANPDQTDTDGDAEGDACDATPNGADADADADGVGVLIDNCPAIANADQLDSDNDGTGDACDATPRGEVSAGIFVIENQYWASKGCVDENGGDLYANGCNGGNDQRWEMFYLGSGWIFKNVKTGQCANDDGYNVSAKSCNYSNAQRWTLDSGRGFDEVRVKNVGRNFCWFAIAGNDLLGSSGNCGSASEIEYTFHRNGDMGTNYNPADYLP
jgi:hypothetical protein